MSDAVVRTIHRGEARVGFGARIGRTLRLSRRRLRRMITVLVVLAVAAATGVTVALTAPALLVSLGFAEPQVITAVPPPAQRELRALPGTAPRPTAEGIADSLDAEGDAMPGQFTGIVLDAAGGDPLWARTADRALVPGSTGKLLTAAAALLTLAPTDTLVTRAVAGTAPGTVVLVGGGDPTLTALPAGRAGVYPDAPRLADLAAQVQRAAPGPITAVTVDTGRYTGATLAPGWDAADIPGGYIAPIESLMVDGGRIDATLQDGPRVQDPAETAGRAFAGMLGVDPDTVAIGAAPANAAQLGSVSSAPVTELVEHLLRSSDNVLAEVLGREVALSRGGEPSFGGAAQQVLTVLGQAGIDPAGAKMVDGSGLSTQDRVPARVLGSVLAAAAAPAPAPPTAELLRPLVSGLPVAGGDGTLDDRFARADASAAGRGVVRAKTGTLNGVSSLAGVVTDVDGRLLIFALMSNGPSPAISRPLLDEMAAQLSRCGCR
ncbi:MAG TPA: D-alanyl-D-alanine carboxypeptidase/D-alanyl-D-alanine-endopeptidase [Pseudonocardia sp.]|nr:D-alanyl-D-alanine carboxypeptidase/D-alanyl-D-alanine-endopeptidase [Pseudonocardia sp.]